MADNKVNTTSSNKDTLKYRGRLGQIGLYLGKFGRIFVYHNDWKVLPMGAVIAAVEGFISVR